MTWGFERVTVAPSPALAEVVSEIWVLRWFDPKQAAERQIHAPPDASVHLLYRVFGAEERSRLELRGPTVNTERKPASGAVETIGVRLRVGMARRILRVAPETIVDQIVLFDQPELETELAKARTTEEKLPAFERFLLARHRDASPLDPRVSQFLERGARGELSDRHLRRLIKRETGLAPKQLEKMARFHSTFEKTSGACANMSELAHEMGYADQAHFTREFKTQTTLTPGSWLARGPAACPFSSRPEELQPAPSARVRSRLSRNAR